MRRLLVLAAAFLALLSLSGHAADPLRVYIRGGVKTHGPNQHEHVRFMEQWTKLLNERGAKAQGGMEWPTAEQFANTDVVVVNAPDPWDMGSEVRDNLQAYVKRGGGLVVIHAGICGRKDPDWVRSMVGGAWRYGKAKWFEGDISLYYVGEEHPITAGASNFDLDDEMYYDLDMEPGARVLASTWTPDQRAQKNGRPFPHIYDTAAQMWTWEKDDYRAFVTLLGHNWKTFELPNYRAILLRGIAWAGKRENVDELCSKEELGSLRYPPGGPSKPADSLTQAVIHPYFTMKLVAAEPLINKPMTVDWDPQGRLWVAETPEYPNGRRGLKKEFEGKEWKDGGGVVPEAGVQVRPGLDRISILTDTDGDGVMDKKDVFADDLELVTGFVFHKDGVIVTQAPDILLLRDTNGDGKADKREKLYTGLGAGDTHAVINNPRWGFDGWIYATHGYSGGDVTSGDGSKKFGRIGSGVVRFKPDGSAIEQYSSKGGNSWGLTVTWDNEIMWTQPTSGDLLMHTVLPEHLLALGKVGKTASYKVVMRSPKSFPVMTWEQQAYRQIDWVGSFTAAAGTALYDGGAWPAEWNGNYFTTEPTINVVHHQIVKPEGVTFTAHKAPERENVEFIGSKDLWFRPIENRVGPDGALYVVDFYNQAVIHNDTRGPAHNAVNAAVRPDRDHYFGRIWRVDHEQAKNVPVHPLTADDAQGLVRALSSVNHPQRMAAFRLIVESGSPELDGALNELANSAAAAPAARVAATWALAQRGKMNEGTLSTLIADRDPAVSRNALRVAAAKTETPAAAPAVLARLGDPDPRVRLAAIVALGAGQPSEAAVAALVGAYSELNDQWQRSAAIGVLSRAPVNAIAAALKNPKGTGTRELITELSSIISEKNEGPLKASLVVSLAGAKGADPELVSLALGQLSGAKSPTPPAWTPELQTALRTLLQTQAANSVLPLIAAWDREGAMTADVQTLVSQMLVQLNDEKRPEAERAQTVSNLIGVRRLNPNILPAVASLLGSQAPEALQKRAIEDLGATEDPSTGTVLTKAYPKLAPALQEMAFAQILKRSEWTRTLLEEIKSGALPLTGFGPIALDKLRHHPDRAVSQFATETIDTIRGPMLKQKDQVISQLLAVVEQGGDVEKGKLMYTASCAVCHRFAAIGTHLGPELTGMGAHPRAELLTHIVDPNREVDPSFAAYNFQTKSNEIFQGIIVRENANSVVVRDAAGEHELRKSNIASRTEVGRSLMPEGFEALGGEMLRDIIAYLQSVDSRYRIIDLRPGFTADTRRGLFNSEEQVNESLRFEKTGDVKVGDVPFKIADAGAVGRNVVVLKGGHGFSRTLPQRVEIPVSNIRAGALHFLGGVGGWAHPHNEGQKAARVLVTFESGETDEIVLTNSVEFADYINQTIKVPGSELAKGIVRDGRQVRTFRKALSREGVIKKIVLESYNNGIAPVFVAITAELGAPRTDSPAPLTKAEAPAPRGGGEPIPPAPAAGSPEQAAEVRVTPPPAQPEQAKGPVADVSMARVLSVGGGSSHDFPRWFGKADSALLQEMKPAWLHYLETPSTIGEFSPNIDVLYLSTNLPMPSEARKGVFDLAERGKGLMLVHAALWHNWNNWPEYNRQLAGGGSRGHDKFGEFEVQVLDRNHPLTKGLPERFKIKDELYYFEPDPKGAKMTVLAQATSPQNGKTFPMIWTVEHPTARIACITLGHDGRARELPEWKTLLLNALRWTATGK